MTKTIEFQRLQTYNKMRKCVLCGKMIGERRFVSPASGPVHEACWTKTF